jgi:hypothetical protein
LPKEDWPHVALLKPLAHQIGQSFFLGFEGVYSRTRSVLIGRTFEEL